MRRRIRAKALFPAGSGNGVFVLFAGPPIPCPKWVLIFNNLDISFTTDWRPPMTLAIGDTAPEFEAETTEGKIRFHD